jgi:hypothetical protein
MKNILLALVILLAVVFACNPPQSTTGTSTDSTGVNNQSDTSNTMRDTSGTMQRDTSMNR